jgi:predicted dehydrogenase
LRPDQTETPSVVARNAVGSARLALTIERSPVFLSDVPLKVAIVGCGKIADGHVQEIQKMPRLASLVAVADLEGLMAEQLAVRYGVPRFYDDIERLLAAEAPDVVHITTPPASHAALVGRAVEAGTHVYVEKPLAPSADETRRILEAVRRAGKKLTIGYSYTFDAPGLRLRELLLRGALGEVVHVDTVYGYDLQSAFGRAVLADGDHWVHRLPGKLLHNNLDHLLCRLPELLPDARPDDAAHADPLGDTRIAATGWRRHGARFGDARDAMLDELRVTFFAGGVSAHAMFSSHGKPVEHTTRVVGTRATAVADHVARTLVLEPRSALPGVFGRLAPAFDRAAQHAREGAKNLAAFARNDLHYFGPMSTLLRRFYASIVDGGPPPIPYRDIVRVAAWMDEILGQVGPEVRA